MRAALPGVEVDTGAVLSDAIDGIRAVKSEEEFDAIRRAQVITDACFEHMLGYIKPGVREIDAALEMEVFMKSHGAGKLAFDTIFVSGAKTSLPHGVPGERRIQEGDFITMDFGVLYQGYCSDMTRTVALGYATDEMKKVYNTVLKAQLAGLAASKAGVSGQSVDAAARDVITEAGYGPYFGHSYGHSLGLEIHEAPNCNQRNTQPMPLHAVCSAEPGIYLPGKFGVRIEDVAIFEENGCTDITHSPKDLLIL